MKLLADTSALLALYLADDRNHAPAAKFLRQAPQARFVLSELVLSELATRLRARVGSQRAVEACASLLASRRYELLFVDRVLLGGALETMRRFADKRLSLTDCASFVLMERLGLEAAFTFDGDFRDCGFEVVP
jgi:uncharacterized protein